jgi:hypothetical protein
MGASAFHESGHFYFAQTGHSHFAATHVHVALTCRSVRPKIRPAATLFPKIGETLDHYEIVAKIGPGGKV